MAMNIETLPISSIFPDPANARQHPTRNIEAIKASLKRFGLQKPLVIDGSSIVRAGNGTLQAAKELGWTEIQCVRTDLTGAEAIAYAISDNRSGELSNFDPDISNLIEGLKLELPDLPTALAFDDLIAAPAPEPTPPEDFKSFDEEIQTDYCCPKCSYAWSGKPK